MSDWLALTCIVIAAVLTLSGRPEYAICVPGAMIAINGHPWKRGK